MITWIFRKLLWLCSSVYMD